jgi:hypothetical protein
MVRKLMLLIICGLTLLIACSKDETLKGNESLLEETNLKLAEQLNEKDKRIIELKQNIEQLNVQMDNFNMEKEQFVFISNISKEFVQAHTTGDKEKLSQLLSENVVLVEKENNLFARIVNSDNFEWLLFNNVTKNQFVDWVIQGYDYDDKTNTFNIYIREFYIDSYGEPESPPTFLSLTFKMYNNEWKIDSLGFDV